MTESRPYTADEIREEFLSYVWYIARYWASLDGSNVPIDATPLDRTTGMAHSLLSALDGCAMSLPAFRVVPDPHPADRAYHEELGENWYPDDVEISGGRMLHEEFYAEGIRRDR